MAAEIDKLAEDAKRAKGMGISYGRLKAMEFAKRMEERGRAVMAAVQQAMVDLKLARTMCWFCGRPLPPKRKKFCCMYCKKQYTMLKKK